MKAKTTTMKLTLERLDFFLFRRSVFGFVLFFGLALWGFWTSYYGHLTEDHPTHIRFHGVAMTLWCLLLILQSGLIRAFRYRVHRWTGRISYLLVPLILFSGAHIAHVTVREMQPGSGPYYYFIALMFNSLILFAALYALAMYYRKQPLIHARYMVCTTIPFLTPITDRIIYKHFDSLVVHVPVLEGMPMVQSLGFALGDTILVALCLWDWLAHKRLNVFPVALALTLLYHASVLFFHSFGWWRAIGDWWMQLPLS